MCCRRNRSYTVAAPLVPTGGFIDPNYAIVPARRRGCCGRNRAYRQPHQPLIVTGLKYAVDAYKSHQAKKSVAGQIAGEKVAENGRLVDVQGMQQDVRRSFDGVDEVRRREVRRSMPPSYEEIEGVEGAFKSLAVDEKAAPAYGSVNRQNTGGKNGIEVDEDGWQKVPRDIMRY